MAPRDDEYCHVLGDSLYGLLRDKVLADVKFAVQSREFDAHRAVLCAASPYFRRLLAGFREATAEPPATIAIEVCVPETFEMVLEFIYCGTATAIGRRNVCDLLRAADQLCLDRLVTYAANFLLDGNIDATNVYDLWSLAGRVSSRASLRDSCLRFISDNIEGAS